MKFSIRDFFSKYDQIQKKLRIWSHLLKKSLMENYIFCVAEIDPSTSIKFQFIIASRLKFLSCEQIIITQRLTKIFFE